MTYMVYNINNEIIFPTVEKSDLETSGSYYKFYQLKLRQLMTQTRYRKEQEARFARMRIPLNKDPFIKQQRFHHEYLNYLRERAKSSCQDSLIDQSSVHEQSFISNRTNPSTVLSTATIATTSSTSTSDSQTKSTIVAKPRPLSPPKPRVPSAPLTRPKSSVQKPIEVLPNVKLTPAPRVKSAIRQRPPVSARRTPQPNEQPIMNTIMLHLDNHPPPNASKLTIYQNIQNKFSASLSPRVYRTFQRSTPTN